MSNLVIPDGGNIGSSSDTDAISISSGGNVTLSQTLDGNINVSSHTLTTSSSQKQAIVDGATITSNDVFQAMVIFDNTTSATPSAIISHNVSGITRNSEGYYNVQWDNDFANTDYYILATVEQHSLADRIITVRDKSASACGIFIRNSSTQTKDPTAITVIAFTN